MIITDDLEAADFMRGLRNQGRAVGDTWLQHTYLGYNYRLDEMSAALGFSQLKRLEALLRKREQVADWYQKYLRPLKAVETQVLVPETTRVSWFVYVIRFADYIDRDRLAQILEQRGVPVRPYFAPIHLQPYMQKMFGYKPGDYPVTEDLGNRSLAIPFSSEMSEAMVIEVCKQIADALISAEK